jgi:putative sterol carrier protein
LGQDHGLARFLTPAWLSELEAAAQASDELRTATADTDLIIEQVITGTPDGEVRYTVRLCRGDAEIRPGSAGRADVTVRQPVDVAAAISRGELDPRVAMDDGRLRVAGDVRVLVAHQGTLQRLASVFDDVRALTTYD